MSFKPLPNCRGCIYLDQEGLCAYHRRAKVSKAKLGVKTGKTGGCALYKSNRRGGGRSPTDYDDRVRDMYDQGHHDEEISQALGYSRTAIYNWRVRHQLPPNGKPGPKTKKILS
jgi:hypothetical protein